MNRSIAFATADQLRAARDDTSIVFMGDSHIKCGIDAAQIPGAFNLGALGAQYHHIYHELRWALEDVGVRPEIVVLTLDTHSFAWQPARIEEAAYWAQRFSYPLLAWRFSHPTYGRRWLDGAWFPYWGEGESMARWAMGRPVEELSYDLELGFVPLDARLSDQRGDTSPESRIAFLHGDYALYNEIEMDYFRRSVALCREHDIDVVFIRTPASDDARRILTEHEAVPTMATMLEKADVELGESQQLDFGDAFAGRPEMFADADHLNRWGANEFSARVAEALKGN